MQKILIIGPAHPLRGGGMTTFNHRLAKQLLSEGLDCTIISFSLQYPSFLFPGKSQYSNEPPPKGIRILPLINSIHPFNWYTAGRRLRKLKPDLVIVRFWLPLMGPALGTVLRILKKGSQTKIICIADNVIPHEKRPGDAPFTRYFLKACDGFITMSKQVEQDLRTFEKAKPSVLVPHPLYDNFGSKVSKEVARIRLGLPTPERIILFFGFIRKYKGLDLLLQAMCDKRIQSANIKLLVAGEFYEDEAPYREIIQKNKLDGAVILHNGFIADADVRYYLCAADCLVQPYRHATQSGVTPLAYHFETPMIVTNVGGLPDLVPHMKSGLVAQPDPDSIANAIIQYFELGEAWFKPGLLEEKEKYSWQNFTQAILELADGV